MLDWLDTNWEAIMEFYDDTFAYNAKNMILNYPLTANTQEDYDKLNALLTAHRGELGTNLHLANIKEYFKVMSPTFTYNTNIISGSSAIYVDQALDAVSANIAWRQSFYDQVNNMFCYVMLEANCFF